MRALDLSGRTFGALTAASPMRVGSKRGWDCVCSCGRNVWVPTFQLTSGNNRTCGDKSRHQTIRPGDRFGKLVVVRVFQDARNRRYLAECRCDCGRIKANASFKRLQAGTLTQCGCSPKVPTPKLAPGVAARNRVIASYKSNAKKKKLDFSLSDAECENLFRGNCYFCGAPPGGVSRAKGSKGAYRYSGIDRADSTRGYVPDNVNSCCKRCNYLKGNKTNADFLGHVRKIFEYRARKAPAPSVRDEEWFTRQETHARKCMDLASRAPTLQELAAARSALGYT